MRQRNDDEDQRNASQDEDWIIIPRRLAMSKEIRNSRVCPLPVMRATDPMDKDGVGDKR